jgi:hypothetical protein
MNRIINKFFDLLNDDDIRNCFFQNIDVTISSIGMFKTVLEYNCSVKRNLINSIVGVYNCNILDKTDLKLLSKRTLFYQSAYNGLKDDAVEFANLQVFNNGYSNYNIPDYINSISTPSSIYTTNFDSKYKGSLNSNYTIPEYIYTGLEPDYADSKSFKSATSGFNNSNYADSKSFKSATSGSNNSNYTDSESFKSATSGSNNSNYTDFESFKSATPEYNYNTLVSDQLDYTDQANLINQQRRQRIEQNKREMRMKRQLMLENKRIELEKMRQARRDDKLNFINLKKNLNSIPVPPKRLPKISDSSSDEEMYNVKKIINDMVSPYSKSPIGSDSSDEEINTRDKKYSLSNSDLELSDSYSSHKSGSYVDDKHKSQDQMNKSLYSPPRQLLKPIQSSSFDSTSLYPPVYSSYSSKPKQDISSKSESHLPPTYESQVQMNKSLYSPPRQLLKPIHSSFDSTLLYPPDYSSYNSKSKQDISSKSDSYMDNEHKSQVQMNKSLYSPPRQLLKPIHPSFDSTLLYPPDYPSYDSKSKQYSYRLNPNQTIPSKVESKHNQVLVKQELLNNTNPKTNIRTPKSNYKTMTESKEKFKKGIVGYIAYGGNHNDFSNNLKPKNEM